MMKLTKCILLAVDCSATDLTEEQCEVCPNKIWNPACQGEKGNCVLVCCIYMDNLGLHQA